MIKARVPKAVAKARGSAARQKAAGYEASIAARTGGLVVKGSGSGHAKADVTIEGVARIEAKLTERKSFSVTRALVAKVEEAAGQDPGAVPAIVVGFMDDGQVGSECAIIPMYALLALIERARDAAK